MAWADLTANLNLNIQNFSRQLNRANSQFRDFSSSVTGGLHRQTEGANGLVQSLRRVNDGLHWAGLGLRDVTRIAAGIVVAQAFYKTTEAIRNATQALWAFNEQLDYAHVTYSALMGDSTLASNFLDTLQQFSINTVFGFSELEGMARKLLAYGIEYKNLMYITEGLTNLGTLSGDPAALERLAVAIGQINAKGTLKQEEIKQLTNAYVPMNDILRDQLGLTAEDMKKNIGDLQISSADAINAIVEYSNEKFGEMAHAAMFTITGLNQRIVDSLKVMGAEMLKPVTDAYKSFAWFLSQQLEVLNQVYQESGLGGVFEHLVPNEYTQQLIREFIANWINGWYLVVGVVRELAPLFTNLFAGIVQGYNIVSAVAHTFLSVVTAVFRAISFNTPFVDILSKSLYIAGIAFSLFVANAVRAFVVAGLIRVFNALSAAVMLLSAVLVRNPIVLGFLAITGVLAGFAAKANFANSAIGNLVKTLSSFSMGGMNADDILQPSTGTGGGAPNDETFWEKMADDANDANDAMDDAGKAADKAAKKANKSLLSFDEVFRLNENTSSGSGAGGASDFADAIEGLENLGSALGGAMVPKIPDFKEFAKGFVGNLYNDLFEAVQTIASGAATGAFLGGLIGFVVGALVTKTPAGAFAGAKLGVKIGAVVGGLFAGFFSDAYKGMEEYLRGMTYGGAAGALTGALVGFVIGAFATKTTEGAFAAAKIGTGIGALVGTGLGAFWATAKDKMVNSLGEHMFAGAAIGTVTGALVGLVAGAFATKTMPGAIAGAQLGAGIGAAIGTGLGSFWDTAGDSFKKSMENFVKGLKAAGMGALLGALAGMIIGAIAGVFAAGQVVPMAMAGARLGAFAGAIGQTIYEMLKSGDVIDKLGVWFSELGDKIKVLWEKLWDVKTWKNAWSHIKGWFGNLKDSVVEWFNSKGIDIEKWWEIAWNVRKWLTGWGMVEFWFKVLNGDMADWFKEKVGIVKDWWENLWVVKAWKNGWSMLITWFTNLTTDVKNWFNDRIGDIKEWWRLIWNPSNWLAGWINIMVWFSALRTAIHNWFVGKIGDIKAWWNNLWNTNNWTNGWTMIYLWFVTLRTAINNWFNERISDIVTWWKGLWNTKNFAEGWLYVVGWFTALRTAINNWFSGRVSDIQSWWNNLWSPSRFMSGWNKVKTWFSNLREAISDWFTSLKRSISSWWDNLFSGKKAEVTTTKKTISLKTLFGGHATGGIFNKEHIARFAEGNKAEAIIPLENNRAMQPFVDAVSRGLLESLAPTIASSGSGGGYGGELPPLYVGTLIADDRGLKELYKKFEIIQAQEDVRRGLATV